MTDKIPTKVYIGFQGESTVIKPDNFDSLDEAVEYVKQEVQENNEARREKPETPRLVFWMNDVFPSDPKQRQIL